MKVTVLALVFLYSTAPLASDSLEFRFGGTIPSMNEYIYTFDETKKLLLENKVAAKHLKITKSKRNVPSKLLVNENSKQIIVYSDIEDSRAFYK